MIRPAGLARQADAFCEASIRDTTGRAAAGRRCAARWQARPTRRSSRCCWSTAASPTTTTCTWPAELLELLLAHGADPDRPGPDGRSPYSLAILQGRADLADLLRRYGAVDDTTDADRFLAACQRADQAAVAEQLAQDPGLPARLSG